MKSLIITSLLTVQIAGFFGGNINNVNSNTNQYLQNCLKNSKIESVLANSFKECEPTLKIAGSTKNTIKLNIEKVDGADGYNVYRATSEDDVSTCIGTTKTGNYVDKNADTDDTNCYTVRAYKYIDGKKVLSQLSEEEKAKCSQTKTTAVAKTTKTTKEKSTAAADKKATTKKTTVAKSNKTTTATKAPVTTPKTSTTTPSKTETTQNKTTTTTKQTTTQQKAPVTTPVTPSKTTTQATPATKPSSETTNQQYDSSFASQVLKLVNQERTKGGLQPLTMSDALVAPANKRAQEIKSQFSHTRPNGTQWSTVLDEYGVSVRTAGENLAYGYNTPEAVVTGWMNSPGHRANIMNANFNKIGIGVYKDSNGTVYCTQLFSN
ncbi:MAG: putative secreted protein [Anaerocolumna sp.]|nr:putative secreted protein [Anaerocolumna sp.]